MNMEQQPAEPQAPRLEDLSSEPDNPHEPHEREATAIGNTHEVLFPDGTYHRVDVVVGGSDKTTELRFKDGSPAIVLPHMEKITVRRVEPGTE
jgi:hypothetical protein